jgi:hypothetical protein
MVDRLKSSLHELHAEGGGITRLSSHARRDRDAAGSLQRIEECLSGECKAFAGVLTYAL